MAPPSESQAEDDQFVSKVGDLPKFDNISNAQDNVSVNSYTSSKWEGVSELVDGLTAKEQKLQAKQLVKDFVKEMVKGKSMNVMTHTGQLKTCKVSLTRDLSQLKLKVGSGQRDIVLKTVEEIQTGAEVEGIDTPADEMCATLVLAQGDCITFRLPDIESRDIFIYCMMMFCNGSK